MRKLTERELQSLCKRCAGVPPEEMLLEGGRWMCEHIILHWTSEDIVNSLKKAQNKPNFGIKPKR